MLTQEIVRYEECRTMQMLLGAPPRASEGEMGRAWSLGNLESICEAYEN